MILPITLFCIIFCSKKVFILGPSHHVRLAGCALSGVEKYETPLYNLTIDQKSKCNCEYDQFLSIVNGKCLIW